MRFLFVIFTVCAVGSLALTTRGTQVRPFVQKYCIECHDADTKKGAMDLTSLQFDTAESKSFAQWVKIHDRVESGEMPPKKKERPDPQDAKQFVDSLNSTLLAADQTRVATEGRATRRRLNRFEYEQTLRDLLRVPYLEVKSFLPEDTQSHGFNKIGDALDVSHVQLSRYLAASEFAVREAMTPQTARPKTTTTRYESWDQREFVGKLKLLPNNRKTIPLVGLELQTDLIRQDSPRPVHNEDPERRAQEAMAVVVSSYEPTEIRFGSFRAPISGKYRLRFLAYTVWITPDFKQATEGHRPEPVTIYAETPPRSLRKLASFDVGPGPTLHEFEAYMLAGETIRPDAARLFRSRPPDHKNPLMEKDGAPGVAFNWMEVDGPLIEEWPPQSHQLLFGDLPTKDRPRIVQPTPTGRRGGGGFNRFAPLPGVEVISQDPQHDAQRLIHHFMQHVYRRPASDADVQRFMGIYRDAIHEGYDFTDAMVAAYTGILSSPAFLYLDEKPGPLDDMALANRLSYFLWNSCPDEQLEQLARDGKLHQSEILREQTERMLNDPRSRRFVNAFLDYWLDMRFVQGPSADADLYPEYQLDDLLVESMLDETQLFFAELIKRDLPTRNLIACDFAMLNERLATHYGIDGVSGVEVRPVQLPQDSIRGGLLTQASVLKVTANGTTTSPVKRGAWIMTRLLGKTMPPPPAGVTALEPDIRGATTIRQQLAKHRDQATCATCHRIIDPAGFALESFDVMGAWRDRYRTMGGEERVRGIGHNGIYCHYSLGQAVDSSGEMPDGRQFENVRQLKQYLLDDQEQVARNLVQQLTIYATGAPIQFSDRPQIAKILDDTRAQGFGVRELICQIVQSEMFRNK